MLKNIALHLAEDENEQERLEQDFSERIHKTYQQNINSFQRFIPSLMPLVNDPSSQNISLFCNQFGETNVVDYGLGRVLYGFHPQQEIKSQFQQFQRHSLYVCFSSDSKANNTNCQLADYLTRPPLPEQINCLVILGLGIGQQVKLLIEQQSIKHLLIYEPEEQYFKCSVLATPWHEILKIANEKGTQIYLQIGKDGRDLLSDIEELQAHFPINGFYLYQHYRHQVFNALSNQLAKTSWAEIKKSGFNFVFNQDHTSYLPIWTQPVDLKQLYPIDEENEIYRGNLTAFQHYVPDVYRQFKNYQPKNWIPYKNWRDEINLFHPQSLTNWYGVSPKKDCLDTYKNYTKQPHRDGLVLGYRGEKLAHYTHYKFVKQAECILTELEEKQGSLPDEIEAMIIFGVGSGYQLEALIDNHKIEKLFICEPNHDFFYASLFAIDWKKILHTLDERGARLYLNVGDDGSHLFQDLLNQFYAIGPYILNNTYFYQSYYNASLNTAIAQLREKLQIVISMGEYFDHAYYGIAHTQQAMRNHVPVLSQNPEKILQFEDKEVPVFLVGNGPSLDFSISEIKAWQDKAIIISCGTALQVMHRNDIVPDFHAEIEQNRATYDWATLINDPAYVKKITLLSCNGVHPHTSALYKKTFIVFKAGESSTVSAMQCPDIADSPVLHHAFPTVSNFACDLFSTLGFRSIYFIGIDLGFIDPNYHHSKASGYYHENGKEVMDFSARHNTGLVVPGNFRPSVNTKHEFKIAKDVLEQCVAETKQKVEYYNCSDGAKIEGSMPLKVDDILLSTTIPQKTQALNTLANKVFKKPTEQVITQFETTFSQEILTTELTQLKTLLNQPIDTQKQANDLLRKQKDFLFNSYKKGQSLLFYYLYGTVNFSNAFMSKTLDTKGINGKPSNAFFQALELWQETFERICQQLALSKEWFDTSCYRIKSREALLGKSQIEITSLLVVTRNQTFIKSIAYYLDSWDWEMQFNHCTPEQLNEQQSADYVIYLDDEIGLDCPLPGKQKTVSLFKEKLLKMEDLQDLHPTHTILPTLADNPVNNQANYLTDIHLYAEHSLQCCLHQINAKAYLIKHFVEQSDIGLQAFTQQLNSELFNTYHVMEHTLVHFVLEQWPKPPSKASALGGLGKPVLGKFSAPDRIYKRVSQQRLIEISQDRQTKFQLRPE